MTVLKKWKMVKVVYILQRGVPRPTPLCVPCVGIMCRDLFGVNSSCELYPLAYTNTNRNPNRSLTVTICAIVDVAPAAANTI